MGILQRLFSTVGGGLDSRLLAGVEESVDSLLRGGRATLTDLGRSSKRQTTPKHRIKTVDRLLGNSRLQTKLWLFFRALAQLVIRDSAQVVILVDWTQVDADHHAIVAAIPVGAGRAVPILIHVHPTARLASRKAHRRFLNALTFVLPSTCTPVLVTDAGFHATWIDDVVAHGWHFVARIRSVTSVRFGTGNWICNKQLHSQAARTAKDLGFADLNRSDPRQRRLILAPKVRKRGRTRLGRRRKPLNNTSVRKHQRAQREPWLLATNLPDAADTIIHNYRLRMQIEETFRDAKNPRFGWALRYARGSTTGRLEVLLLITALGQLAVLLIGLAAEKRNLHLMLQANTTKSHRVLSLFTVGLLVLSTPGILRLRSRQIATSWDRIRPSTL